MLVDSHCHLNMLDLAAFDGSLDKLMAAARENNVETMLCVNVDRAHQSEVIGIAEQYDNVYASVGLHPSEAVSTLLGDEEILRYVDHPKVVAIGETGLDYYYNDTGLEQQRDSFAQHVRLAKQTNLPLIIHTRAAQDDTLAIMRDNDAHQCGGVMHCFTEALDMAEAAMAMGFYVSISGIVTFKNAKNVQEVAAAIPMDRLLIETDAPYLTPVPYRGKPNGPQYVGYVAEKIAELKGLSVEEVAQQTTENFYALFNKASRADG